jgi:hypothetical protein
MADAPFGKVMGLAILRFNSTQTTSRTDSEVQCVGKITLNNATDHTISYRFYIKGDRWYVEARITDL